VSSTRADGAVPGPAAVCALVVAGVGPARVVDVLVPPRALERPHGA
jgi:hypothetical protein